MAQISDSLVLVVCILCLPLLLRVKGLWRVRTRLHLFRKGDPAECYFHSNGNNSCFVLQISFKCVMYFSARCFHNETVSDYSQFPYFCPFVVRDVASGFSMRNREKQNKYRTIPQHCARTGIGSIVVQAKRDILKTVLESRPFSPSSV